MWSGAERAFDIFILVFDRATQLKLLMTFEAFELINGHTIISSVTVNSIP